MRNISPLGFAIALLAITSVAAPSDSLLAPPTPAASPEGITNPNTAPALAQGQQVGVL